MDLKDYGLDSDSSSDSDNEHDSISEINTKKRKLDDEVPDNKRAKFGSVINKMAAFSEEQNLARQIDDEKKKQKEKEENEKKKKEAEQELLEKRVQEELEKEKAILFKKKEEMILKQAGLLMEDKIRQPSSKDKEKQKIKRRGQSEWRTESVQGRWKSDEEMKLRQQFDS
eukprot:GCRY01002392.1.p1 GENE.GCRY01002392.1~~GCRY01002392.1.p1  ORF type:complete len:170 (+),score=45.11 GCRY01002392.1:237-746(+)